MRLVRTLIHVIWKILKNKIFHWLSEPILSKWLMHDATKPCVSLRSIQRSRQSKGFYVTEYEKFIDLVLNSTLQLTLKNILLLKCSIESKKNIPNWLKSLARYFIFELCGTGFSLYTSTKVTSVMRIQLSCLKPEQQRDLQSCKQCTLTIFKFWKNVVIWGKIFMLINK